MKKSDIIIAKDIIDLFGADSKSNGVYHLHSTDREVVIKALEMQIPKKPMRNDTIVECPVCGTLVRYMYSGAEWQLTQRIVEDNFCTNCGQRLDWSDSE